MSGMTVSSYVAMRFDPILEENGVQRELTDDEQRTNARDYLRDPEMLIHYALLQLTWDAKVAKFKPTEAIQVQVGKSDMTFDEFWGWLTAESQGDE